MEGFVVWFGAIALDESKSEKGTKMHFNSFPLLCVFFTHLVARKDREFYLVPVVDGRSLELMLIIKMSFIKCL